MYREITEHVETQTLRQYEIANCSTKYDISFQYLKADIGW